MHHNAWEKEVNNMNSKDFNLKVEIIKKFGSQIAFAKKVGASELFISQVITGRRKLSPETRKVWYETLKRKGRLNDE